MSQQIGFIGAGQMATALAKGFVASSAVCGCPVICFYDPFPAAGERFLEQIPDAQNMATAADVIESCDLVFLAVKPQVMPSVLDSIASNVTESVLLVSIAAGITLDTICSAVGTGRVIRVMPNTPCLVATAATVFSPGPSVSETDCTLVRELLESVGISYQLDERYLDAVTGLSGSGPAYIYTIIEALSDGGVEMGLPRDIATKLAAQTVKGAGEMVLQTGNHPGLLKDQVTSPGGTTIAGLRAMQDQGVAAAMMAAVEAATLRCKELSN